MKKISFLLLAFFSFLNVFAIDLAKATIVYDKNDVAFAGKMANVLADDISLVCGNRPVVSTKNVKGKCIILRTPASKYFVSNIIKGEWERYTITSDDNSVIIEGSDARGLAYGVFHLSEKIGVSPWYWWADVPVMHKDVILYSENFVSKSPSVKYRGIFINDEDWGLKTWSSRNFEKELGDIGPKTYDKACELILRLRGNMLAPAMHSCTGAFYSHPESQVVADSWKILITTSHCEPLLFNNAAHSEWDSKKDGEWNYATNKSTIISKLDNRIKETAQYDNIYTMGMRGLHDEAMKGSRDPKVRAKMLEQVFADQRAILQKYKKTGAEEIPQIFVPYKETLDIYDAGLNVPEDITIVWPDDNYGYMKRVSNPEERKRRGGSGLYYHLSYLGTPHDYLWMNTTSPVLMYEEIKKAYDAGANRYWLLNVGDIKPMEMGVQTFMDMAWDFDSFDYGKAYSHQIDFLSCIFGKYVDRSVFEQMLQFYYRNAWDRKPEYMGYEIQWDSKENERLHDMGFDDVSMSKRDMEYSMLNVSCMKIMKQLPEAYRTCFFELFGYSAMSAYYNNSKYHYAALNHKTGLKEAAHLSRVYQHKIDSLLNMYNTINGGKWNQMLSEVPPGFVSQYQKMPDLVTEPTDKYLLPQSQMYTSYSTELPIYDNVVAPFNVLSGLGTNYKVLQLGAPHDDVHDASSLSSPHHDVALTIEDEADSIRLQISTVPVWPLFKNRSNAFGVCIDGCKSVVCKNDIVEWSYTWKLQVLENRKDYLVTLPLSKKGKEHTLSFIVGDPGQMIQKVTYEIVK